MSEVYTKEELKTDIRSLKRRTEHNFYSMNRTELADQLVELTRIVAWLVDKLPDEN